MVLRAGEHLGAGAGALFEPEALQQVLVTAVLGLVPPAPAPRLWAALGCRRQGWRKQRRRKRTRGRRRRDVKDGLARAAFCAASPACIGVCMPSLQWLAKSRKKNIFFQDMASGSSFSAIVLPQRGILRARVKKNGSASSSSSTCHPRPSAHSTPQ